MEREEFLRDLKQIVDSSPSYGDRLKNLECMLTVMRRRLPDFLEGHIVTDNRNSKKTRTWEFFYRNQCYGKPENYPLLEQKEVMIDPAQCIGKSWVFTNDRSGWKPEPKKLAELLDAPQRDDFFVEAVGDYYYCGDGNHRIYAAYLLGRQVLVNVSGERKRICSVEEAIPWETGRGAKE